PTRPKSRTGPERRTAAGVTCASRLPARAEDFTRTRPAPDETSCKTVGSAYVGSNPTPATRCENAPPAANSRAGGAFCLAVAGLDQCEAFLAALDLEPLGEQFG